jgi:hypothetical protein
MEWSEGDMSLNNPVTPPGFFFVKETLLVKHTSQYASLGGVRL